MNKNIVGIISILFVSAILIFSFVIYKNPHIFTDIINRNKQNVNLPPEFPEIPKYPLATLVDSYSENRLYGKYIKVSWSSMDSVPVISTWYSKSLKENGWSIDIEPADYSATDIQYMVAIKNYTTIQLSIIKNAEEKVVYIEAEIQPINEEGDY